MKALQISTLLGLIAMASPATAHFPWLIVNEDGKAALFFGENMADRTYKMPEALTTAKIQTKSPKGPQKLQLGQVESEQFVGMVSKADVAEGSRLTTQITYGIYHGNRLQYCAEHVHGRLPTARDDSSSSGQKSTKAAYGTQLVDTDKGVDLYVTWEGKPLAGIEVHLYCKDGHEEAVAKTDEQGKVSFTDKEVEDGLNGIMFGQTLGDDGGKLDGEEYEATMHYYTLTFFDPEDHETTDSK